MPVNHRFSQHDFGNNFQTHNAILDVIPYEPEVLFVGTFNPNNKVKGGADFFYGREGSYFWPVLWNIFVHKQVKQISRRKYHGGSNPYFTNPDLDAIKSLCSQLKISFADLIKNVNVSELTGYKDADLARAARKGLVDWGSNHIQDYLKLRSTIHTVYLTLQSCDVWNTQWNKISSVDYGRPIKFIPIYTPTGQRLQGSPRIQKLMCHWLFNNHYAYGRIDHEWLRQHGVPIEHFAQICQG